MSFRGSLLLVCAVLLACGKSRIDDGADVRRAPWDPPTNENGFRPLYAVDCVPSAVEIPRTASAPIEEVAALERAPHSVAADASSIYWVESNAIYRASRATAGSRAGTWTREHIATEENSAEVVVGKNLVYWTRSTHASQAGGADHPAESGAVRFLAKADVGKADARVETLASEATRPERLVAEGESLFWISGDHLREARGAEVVRNLMSTRLMPRTLAADEGAVYAFTTDLSLLRIPRDGTPPVVLVSTTKGTPVDLVVDDGFAYWIEKGPACEGGRPVCHTGYQVLRERDPHPKGALRRVPVAGGTVEDVAADLPDVETLNVRRGIAWLTTARGLLKVRLGAAPSPPASSPERMAFAALHVAGKARPTSIGDAIVFAGGESQPSVSLIGGP